MWWRLQPPISSPIGALQHPPCPPLGLLPYHAGPGSREFLALTTKRWGGLLVASLDIASSSDSRSKAATGERLDLGSVGVCVQSRGWVSPVEVAEILLVWRCDMTARWRLGRCHQSYGERPPRGLGASDLRTVPELRVGSGKKLFVPA